jgi:DNA-binding TFAR19-related protein (PDSD5 family)
MVFKPGQSGNPAGRPPLPAELKAIKDLSPQLVRKIIAKLALMDRKTMFEWLEKPQDQGGPNNMEMMVASIITKAITDGDQSRLNFLLDRSIGKVVEQKVVQLQPVEYVTSVRADGALVQSVINEALGEDDGGGTEDSHPSNSTGSAQ